jgi:hypothetical protein
MQHVDECRIPQIALFSLPHGVRRPAGGPPVPWQHCVRSDQKRLGLPPKMDDPSGFCLLRGAWRSMVYNVTHLDAVGAPLQVKAAQVGSTCSQLPVGMVPAAASKRVD